MSPDPDPDGGTATTGVDDDETEEAKADTGEGGNSETAEAPETDSTNESSVSPAPLNVPSADIRDVWVALNDDEGAAARQVKQDLTPEAVDLDRPDEFEFGYIPTEDLPSGVQYTPEFDPDWVYPSGSSDGGRQDDTPVQGLEIGVLATDQEIEVTVHAVLDAISLYYEDTGQYPRHRIIESAEAFEESAADGTGLVAIIQPSPDDHDGLVDHMETVRSGGEGSIDSNVETSRTVVQYLGAQLASEGLGEFSVDADVVAVTDWDTAVQVGSLPIVERYAPLGAAEVYDPEIEDLDLSEDGVPSVTDADFTPQRLSIETNADLFETENE